MLHAGLEGAQSIGSAKVGDKTRLDTLVPAIEALVEAAERGRASAISWPKLAKRDPLAKDRWGCEIQERPHAQSS